MIVHQGIYLPDGETHLTAWMTKAGELVDGRGTYQVKKLRTALEHVRQFRTAIDVGGHCGLWSMHLAKRFQHVDAFEPVAAHRECFRLNVKADNVTLHACALGAKDGGHVVMKTEPTSSGDSYPDPSRPVTRELGLPAHAVPMRSLDALHLANVDFIKIDCEGYEMFVLEGAVETIKTNWPTIIVEQKPGHAQRFGFGEKDAVPFLMSMGYKLARELSGDFVMVPG